MIKIIDIIKNKIKIIMKMKQFLNSNVFQDIFLSKDEKEIKYFLENGLLFAVMAKIEDGYIISEKQKKDFYNTLTENINRLEALEEIMPFNLEDKIIYEIIYNHLSDKINSQTINQYPQIKNWLMGKTNEDIANGFFEVLMKKTKSLNNKDNQTIRNFIDLFEKNHHYLNYLEKDKSNLLIEEIKNFINKDGSYSHQLRTIIDTLSIKNYSETKNLIGTIHKELNNQKEDVILNQLKEIDEYYFKIIDNSIEMNYKESLKNLYEKYLINNINNYLKIPSSKRELLINNKKAIDMLLTGMNEVLEIYKEVLKNIDEQKLNGLSGKKEYFKQIKKW